MAGSFDNTIFERVRQAPANDIVEVLSEHLSLARKGKEYVGLCPFHQDSNPSLYVNREKGIFKCFACGAGGDIFKFVQMRENVTFAQALERLAERAGIELEKKSMRRTDSQSGNADQNGDPAQIARVNLWAQRLWQKCFYDEHMGAGARSYVAQRKIDPEIAKQWGLGFAPDSWDFLVGMAQKAGIAESLLIASGLAVSRQGASGCYDKFRNRLMFPIVDTTGRVIAFGGRTLADDPAKYMNSPATVLFDKSNSLYGLDMARHEIVRQSKAVVVEGYTDVMMSHQFGCSNVIAALGTSFTAGHARLIRRFAEQIVLILDSDVAGIAAANRALEVCISSKVDVRIASVPSGKDPCEYLLTAGADAFRNVIDNAQDVFEYKWDKLKTEFQTTSSLSRRKEAIEEFLRTVAVAMSAGTLDSISKGLIIRRITSLLGLSDKEIKSELAKLALRHGNSAVIASENRKVVRLNLGKGYLAKAQREILEVLLNEPSLYKRFDQFDEIDANDFSVPMLNVIARCLFDLLGSDADFSLSALIASFEDLDTSSCIVELAGVGEDKGNYEQRLTEAVNVLVEHKKSREIEIVKQDTSDDGLRNITMKLRDTHADKNSKRNIRKRIFTE